MFTACQEKENPIPMSIELEGVQLDINGSQAGLVAADTLGLIIARDSVVNEATDTIYNVSTNVTLVLDGTFIADKMEEKLLLNVIGADGTPLVSLAPTDSMIVDSLVAFLKNSVGEKIEIRFAGKTEKSKFLKLDNVTKVALTGFSFHQLDPEAMADPKITSLIDKFEKLAKEINKDIKEFGYLGVGNGRATEIGAMRIKLSSSKSKMTPKQLERFKYILSHYETEF